MPGPFPPLRKERLLACWPELLTLPIIILLMYRVAQEPLTGDVSWQLWIAHHIRAGARLYIDILEVNPPLWFWMAIPIDWLSGTMGIKPALTLVMGIGLALMASLTSTGLIIRSWISDNRSRALLLVFAAAVVLIMPLADIGQREQYTLIAAIPYIALVAARISGQRVPIVFALAIGVGGALGFALKHYFLIVPFLLELGLFLNLRAAWRPIRPETMGFAMVGLVYAIALLVFAPEFLTSMVPMLRLAYGSLSAWKMPQPMQIVWLLMLAMMAPAARDLIRYKSPFSASLLVAAVGFAVAWFIQHKGWKYQAIATTGCLQLALASMLAENKISLPTVVKLVSPLILAMPLVLGVLLQPYIYFYQPILQEIRAGLKADDNVAFVTYSSNYAWPFTENHGLRYPSRYYSFWMLDGIRLAEQGNHDPRLAELGRRVAAETASDYRCAMPARIAFVRPFLRPKTQVTDTLEFFQRDPGFAALMTHYRPWRRIDEFDVYTLTAPWPRPPASECRRGV